MGIRSDVGFAVKRDCWGSLSVEQRAKVAAIIEEADATYENDEGFLFTWRDIKWYESYSEINDFLKTLQDLDYEGFLLVVATPEYPEDNSGDLGDWVDNPWNVHRYSTCTLEFDL